MTTSPSTAAASPPISESDEQVGLRWRLLWALPIALPAALAAFSIVAMVALLAGHFSAGLVLPVGLLAALVAGAVALRVGFTEGRTIRDRWADFCALVLSLAWLGANLPLSSQRVTLFRDPATYANTAVYLTHHDSLPIPAFTSVFGAPHAGAPLQFSTTGFPQLSNPDQLQAQGAHLLQALLASAGWIGGNRAVFSANLVIGALGLLAIYGVGRRLISAWWALGATVVLSISLPMLEFSRATYTEPLAMLFVFGGLGLLMAAHQTRKLSAFALAGLTFGATAMTRIDGLLTLLAVIVYAAVVLLQAITRGDRKAFAELTVFVLPVVLDAVLAVRDLQVLAARYYHDLGDQIHQIRLAAIGLIVLTIALCLLALLWRRWQARSAGASSTTPHWAGGPRYVSYAGGALMVLAMTFLGVRRLWYQSHLYQTGGTPQYITFLQKAGHLKIDGSRTYSELSVTWIVWYFGIVAVVVGILGLGLVTAKTLKTLSPPLVLGLGAWIFAAYYLYDPKIVPDQIWGSRRLLPIVLPGLLLAAAALLALLARQRRLGTVVAVVIGVVIFVQTSLLGGRLAFIRQDTPELAEAQALCRALPSDAAVVVTSELANTYLEPVRSFCDVPAAALTVTATPQNLAALQAAAAKAGKKLYALTSGPGKLPGISTDAKPFSAITWRAWNSRLTKPPCCAGAPSRTFWLGQVSPPGTVVAVTAKGPGEG